MLLKMVQREREKMKENMKRDPRPQIQTEKAKENQKGILHRKVKRLM